MIVSHLSTLINFYSEEGFTDLLVQTVPQRLRCIKEIKFSFNIFFENQHILLLAMSLLILSF